MARLKDFLERLRRHFRGVPAPGYRELGGDQGIAPGDDLEARARLLRRAIESLQVTEPEGARLVAELLGDEALVAVVRARSDWNDSLFYAHHIFAEVDALARKHGPPPEAVLEIGPGANLGVLFCFAAAGTERAVGVDIQPAPPPPQAFYAALYDYLACVEGFSWWRYFATVRSYPGVTFPPCASREPAEAVLAGIDYEAPVAAERLPFPDRSFDLVFSVAALEHVPRPAETIGEIRRVLRPGGLAVHEIDVKHHGAEDPLGFLAWSETEYLGRAKPYGEGRSLAGILDGSWTGEVFSNRLRLSDWRELFERYGLHVLEVEPNLVYDPARIERERFVEPFRSKSLEDLAVLGFRIVATKPR